MFPGRLGRRMAVGREVQSLLPIGGARAEAGGSLLRMWAVTLAGSVVSDPSLGCSSL